MSLLCWFFSINSVPTVYEYRPSNAIVTSSQAVITALNHYLYRISTCTAHGPI
ncbi:hypothetical protein SCLCIDRAFT_930437, partial [Scleroderma citrinum Foug A]